MPSLLGLYAQLHPDDVPVSDDNAEEIFEQFNFYPGSTLLLGFVGDQAVTTCALVVVPNFTRGGAPYALIENMVTDESYRNRGFGKAVLKEAIATAWKQNCYKVMLLTGRQTASTLDFYRSVGFQNTKTGFQIRRG